MNKKSKKMILTLGSCLATLPLLFSVSASGCVLTNKQNNKKENAIENTRKEILDKLEEMKKLLEDDSNTKEINEFIDKMSSEVSDVNLTLPILQALKTEINRRFDEFKKLISKRKPKKPKDPKPEKPEEPKSEEEHKPIPEQDKLIGISDGYGNYKYDLKLAHWNLCQFSEKSFNQNKPKGQAIASIIFAQKYDIVGLTEVDGDGTSPKSLAEYLNDLEKKNNSETRWESIVSSKYPITIGSGQADYGAAFVYKTNMVKIIPFKDGSNWKFYDNSIYEKKWGGIWNKYSRAPFGVRFKSLIKNVENCDFTFTICHFDSPGAKKGEEKVNKSSSGGSAEYNEAWNLQYVMKWFNEQANDDDVVFQGDTNIKKNNLAFSWTKNVGAKIALGSNDKQDKTSLSRSIGKLSQPYDKIIHYSNLKFSNSKIYNIWNFIKDNFFQYSKIKNINEWFEYCSTHGTTPSSDVASIYGNVSDHCPISYDLELNSGDTK
ncbi:endonuclease/exonuclease/phosphatase family protein [Metamycoplasma equirhinis]|uniref:endonuclease/exonuclease/phosphatase family protein n=1 Tax=Metamycoplasma equirhinis TaxID=92402 RepID=UPI0035948889